MSLLDIVTHKGVIILFLGWFVPQLIKVILSVVIDKKLNIHRLVGSGGMPSSHLSAVSAVATYIYVTEGISSLFIAIVGVGFYIFQDATVTRRETEKQSQILNDVLKSIKAEKIRKHVLKELIGHTHLQAIVGAIIGIAITLLVV